MKFVLSSLFVLPLGLFAIPQIAGASSLGFPTFSNTHAFFDTFPARIYTGDAPDAAITTAFTATMNNTFPASPANAGLVTGGGDRLYNGWNASSVAFNIQLNGSVTGSADRLELYVKLTPPDVATGLTRTTFFTPNLVTSDGDPIDPSAVEIVADTGESVGSLPFGVISYVWTGLGLTASDTFTIQLSSPASGHVSIDAIALTVPEPGTLALLGLALTGLVTVARRGSATAGR
jgi:hypothetical protein